MKKLVFITLSVWITAGLQAKDYSVALPSNNLVVRVSVDRQTSYSVFFHGKELIVPSAVSMALSDGSVLGKDAKVKREKTGREAKIIGELVQHIRNLRATNCLMDFCYTADGRLGGCINQSTRIWDIAGPALLVEEAGGVFTDAQGLPIQYMLNESDYGKNYTVAGSNKTLHVQIIQLIKNTEL